MCQEELDEMLDRFEKEQVPEEIQRELHKDMTLEEVNQKIKELEKVKNNLEV